MKRVILLLLILLFSSVATTVYAEDVLIIHQGYANSHIKWKNRLEDAGHTVTSVQVGSNGSNFPSDTTSYEQIYDVRHGWPNGDQNLSSAQITAYKGPEFVSALNQVSKFNISSVVLHARS